MNKSTISYDRFIPNRSNMDVEVDIHEYNKVSGPKSNENYNIALSHLISNKKQKKRILYFKSQLKIRKSEDNCLRCFPKNDPILKKVNEKKR